MRNLFLTILLLLLINPLFANEGKKYLEQVGDNTYYFVEYDTNGKLLQKGYYILINGNYILDGLWYNSKGTKARYNEGELVWIKPKGHPRYTYKQIELEQLKAEVRRLRNLIVLNDQS